MMKKLSFFAVMMALLMMVTAVWALAPQTEAGGTTSNFITEYTIPVPDSNPQYIAVESAGPPASLWFTMMDADAIGHLVVTSTVDFTFTTYPLTAGSEPFDIVYDESTGLLWFTEPGLNHIGQLDIATEMITETAVPNNQMPRHIDVAPNGAVWFTEPDANQVVRYQPTTHIFTNFAYNLADGAPDQIEVLNNTSVWITAPGVNRVAELQVGGGNYVNIPVSDIGSPTFPPGGLALDESGPWITAPTADRIGRYAPGTIAFWNWYAMPLVPNNLTYTGNVSNKTLWFTSTDSGRVGRLLLDNQGRIKSFGIHTLPTLDSEPIAVAVGNDGVAWITESGGNKIASWQPPYFYEWFLPVVRKGE